MNRNELSPLIGEEVAIQYRGIRGGIPGTFFRFGTITGVFFINCRLQHAHGQVYKIPLRNIVKAEPINESNGGQGK